MLDRSNLCGRLNSREDVVEDKPMAPEFVQRITARSPLVLS